MKANELMIGDWVYYENSPVQIKGIDSFKSEYVSFGDEFYPCKDFEPIHLTSEVLEKIGFSTEPNIGYIIDDYDGTQIIYDSWNNNLRIIKDYKTCLDIKTFSDLSVHELQHALRICGIEKEIEL